MPTQRARETQALLQGLPVVPADLTWVRVNGGRGYAQIVNWDDDRAPTVGQRVLTADGGSERFEATITEVRANGTLVLEFPDFAHATRRLNDADPRGRQWSS
ncbi:hypothetical protein ACNKF0_09465 [Nocardioides sp. T5]|uniref:hypothetical protein n=1 Tax=Nocardioides sp. T5 TaxID=3400182 RepID=UPI003A83B3AD